MLKDALLKAGVVSEKDVERVEKQQKLEEEIEKVKKGLENGTVKTIVIDSVSSQDVSKGRNGKLEK